MLAEWTLAARNLFFPQFCTVCGRRLLTEENGYFCPTCWESSPRIARPFCTACGRPHPGMVGLGNLHNFPCADCREKPNKYITRIFGAAVYDGAIAEGIKRFKFHRKCRLARPLGELMRDFAAQEMETGIYSRIVPVPLHRVRQRERGFNQSALLAEEALSVFDGAKLDTTLKRIRPTRVQSRLEPQDRRGNVRGAFAVDGPDFPGESLLLIDDVVTTGGTVSECARVLRKAGASRVDVLAVALSAPGQRMDDLVW